MITNPKLHSKGRFLHYGAWVGADRQLSYKERLRHAIRDALAKGPADFNTFLRLMEESGYAVKRGRGGAISFLVPRSGAAAGYPAPLVHPRGRL